MKKQSDKTKVSVLDFLRSTKIIKKAPLAKRINMNKSLLAQYISGNKAPSKKQLKRIENGVVELGCELMTVGEFSK